MRDYQWTAYIGFETLLFACLSIAVMVLGRCHFSAREMLRKVMHFITGMLSITLYCVIDSTLLLISLCLIGIGSIYAILKAGLLDKTLRSKQDTGYGYVTYPFGLLFLAVLPFEPLFVIVSISILAVSDSAAALVGRCFTPTVEVFGCRRSYQGMAAFSLVTFLSVLAGFWIAMEYVTMEFVMIAFIASIVLGHVEILSSSNLDNLTILFLGPTLLTTLASMEFADLYQWSLLCIVGIMLIAILHRLNWFDEAGNLVAVAFVVLFAGIGGLSWLAPIVFFTVVTSIFRKSENHRRRNVKQVLMNGGFPLLILLIGKATEGEVVFYTAYLAAIAFKFSDTIASEIGLRFGGAAYLIKNLKPAQHGDDGAISVWGTCGGTVAACAIGLMGLILAPADHVIVALAATISGVGGMLIDSLIGALFQDKSDGGTNIIFTHNVKTGLTGVYCLPIGNLTVNFISHLLSVTIAILIFLLLS